MKLQNRMTGNLTGILLAISSALGFSTLALWGKFAVRLGFDSSSLNVYRFLFAGLVLLALGYGRRTSRALLGKLLLFGLWYASNTWLYFQALGKISASVATILVYLAPAFVILIRWALGHRPNSRQLQALGLVSLGLIVIVGLPGPADANVLGLLLAASAGAFYGAYLVASERWLGHVEPMQQTTFNAFGTALGFTVFALFGGGLHFPSNLNQWGLVAGIVTFSTLIALPTLFAAIKHIGASRASILSSLEPVFATLLAWFVLSEPPSNSNVIGGLLILSGAILAQFTPSATGSRSKTASSAGQL
jgi:drug/metabolite transporter (DMT)-like permease